MNNISMASVHSCMDILKLLIIFSLITLPITAAAQTRHISADPTPETQRCQNHHAAFHTNGDVVMVEYHGQWRDFEDGGRAQNAGFNGQGCEIERVVRLTPERKVVWAIRPTAERDAHGFARQDMLHALVAMPDGGTVVSTTNTPGADHLHSRLLYIESNGDLRWKLQTEQAPMFSMLTPHVGPGGQLIVEIEASNFGYDNGRFQLPGGKTTKLRKHQQIFRVARINVADAKLLWEHANTRFADTFEDGVVTINTRFTNTNPPKTRFVIRQISFDGKLASEATTPWLQNESLLSAAYERGHLIITTRKEHFTSDQHVERRTGNLRVFDSKGRLVHTRELADGSRLAERSAGAPLRIVSPTSCIRGVAIYACVTDALHVITLKDWQDSGSSSQLTLPRRGLLENDYFEATSTPDGLWLSAKTYYGSAPGDAHHPESVTALFSPDDTRTPIQAPTPFVWTPNPEVATPSNTPVNPFALFGD